MGNPEGFRKSGRGSKDRKRKMINTESMRRRLRRSAPSADHHFCICWHGMKMLTSTHVSVLQFSFSFQFLFFFFFSSGKSICHSAHLLTDRIHRSGMHSILRNEMHNALEDRSASLLEAFPPPFIVSSKILFSMKFFFFFIEIRENWKMKACSDHKTTLSRKRGLSKKDFDFPRRSPTEELARETCLMK